MPAVPDGPRVNGDERPLFDLPVSRDAVDDLAIERDADKGREAVVTLEVGCCPVARNAALRDGIQLGGARPWDCRLLYELMNFGNNVARAISAELLRVIAPMATPSAQRQRRPLPGDPEPRRLRPRRSPQ